MRRAAAIISVSRSVAIHLQKRCESPPAAGADPEAQKEDQKRIIKYYLKWLNDNPSRGLSASPADLAAIGDAIYAAARRLNGIGEDVASFLELWGEPVKERRAFHDAAFVLSLLAQGKGGQLKEPDRLKELGKLARCRGFAAADAQDFQAARSAYTQVVETAKVLRGEKLDPLVLKTNPILLAMYLELGAVHLELGKAGQKVQFETARNVFGRVLGQTDSKLKEWWIAKYLYLSVYFYRGVGRDVENARTGLDSLEGTYPGFDGDKFNMKARFLDLKEKIARVMGGAAPPGSPGEPARSSQ